MKKTRFFAGLLATVMLLSLLPISALAEGSSEHLTECGFVCTHVHSEECGYYVPTGENVPCAHGDDCGYVAEDVYGVCDCAAEAVEGVVTHGETCASLTVVTAAAPCGHADGDAKETVTETPDACAHTCGGDEWVCAEGCAVLFGGASGEGTDRPTVEEVTEETLENGVFYVTANGSNETGDGSAEAPFATVGQAILAANGEDTTIYISGTVRWDSRYNRADDLLVNGWVGNSVHIIGLEGTAPMLQFKSDINDQAKPSEPKDTYYELRMHGPLQISSLELYMSDYNTTDFLANGYPLVIDADVTKESVDKSNNGLNVYGGSSETSVASTDLQLLGAKYGLVFGGGRRGGGVTGNANIVIGENASVQTVFGSGYRGDVGGKTTIIVKGYAMHVYGACRATVTGDVEISVPGKVVEVSGGGYLSTVKGNVHMDVPATGNVTALFYGGGTNTKPIGLGGTGSWSIVGDNTPEIPNYETMVVEQSTYITVEGFASAVAGAGFGGGVKGDTNVTVSGRATTVKGGGYGRGGDVYRNTFVTISGSVETEKMKSGRIISGDVCGAGHESTVWGNTSVILEEGGSAYVVLGGGLNGGVQGSADVKIYGAVLTLGEENKNADDVTRYSGDVYGGGYTDSTTYMEKTTVEKGTNVYIASSADVAGSVYGGANFAHTKDTNVIVEGAVKGNVFAGGATADGDTHYKGEEVLGYVDGNATVTLRGTASVKNIYAGGLMSSVWGTATVIMEDSATAENVYGCGKLENARWSNGKYEQFGPIINFVKQDSLIKLTGNASVTGAICGYLTLGIDRAVTGTATVTFDSNTSTAKQIINADAVTVANASTVTIDNEGKDNDQLVNVSNLSVTGKSKLTLPASAHILGNYAGDTAEQKGTLVLSAGKGLTADGTVTNLTDISIVDTETVKPAEAQVYVVSKLGSTKTDGDFTWIDRRTGLAMEWKANTDQTSQWWLVKYTEPVDPPVGPVDPGVTTYSVTVKYVDQDGKSLASDYTTRKNAGSSYDVSAQAARAIAGYAIDRVDGAPVGTVQGNVTITVHYKSNTGEPDIEIPDVAPPLTDLPETEIPTGPTPEVPGGGDTVIVDPEVPMGNLPQTGAEAYADIPFGLAFGVLGLSLSVACVAVALKKKES